MTWVTGQSGSPVLLSFVSSRHKPGSSVIIFPLYWLKVKSMRHFLDQGSLLSNDFSLCQVDRKLAGIILLSFFINGAGDIDQHLRVLGVLPGDLLAHNHL